MVLLELVSRQCLILRSFVIQSNRQPYYIQCSCVLEYHYTVNSTIYTVHKYYFPEDGGTCPAHCTLRYSVLTEGQTGDMRAGNF